MIKYILPTDKADSPKPTITVSYGTSIVGSPVIKFNGVDILSFDDNGWLVLHEICPKDSLELRATGLKLACEDRYLNIKYAKYGIACYPSGDFR